MKSDVSNTPPTRRKRILTRILMLLLAATCIGWTLHQSARFINRSSRPAGFALGVVQGALMPLALPNLAVGEDVMIYASNNTGRGYKLGYTAGVNLCGLLFFGLFFWRVNRWRRREREQERGQPCPHDPKHASHPSPLADKAVRAPLRP